MWHAARKQERMIRVMMVDYQKRAGRRREYYECIKQDPNQFLRVYGRSMKIHIDPSLSAVADGPQVMQPWQGDPEVLIDRYDVRSHIDYLPVVQNHKVEEDPEESRCSYERYRILVQNDCAGVTEDQCLHQIHHDEMFGSTETSTKNEEEKKKKLAEKRAAIGFVYDDDGGGGSSKFDPSEFKKVMDEEEPVSDEEIDLDNILDIDLLTDEQEQVLNGLSQEYGMEGNDYAEFLQLDRDELEAIRAVRQIEEEKAQFSGRKSRRERRAFKERRLRNRKLSPPSYAAKTSSPNSLKLARLRESSSSRSRSRSPSTGGVVEFITSFGGTVEVQSSDDDIKTKKPTLGPSLPPEKTVAGPKPLDKEKRRRSRSRQRSRSHRKRSRSPRRRSRSPRRRSKSFDRTKSGRRSRSPRKTSRRSRSPKRSYRRSRSRSNGDRNGNTYRRRRSGSRSNRRSISPPAPRDEKKSTTGRKLSNSRSRSSTPSRMSTSRSKSPSRSEQTESSSSRGSLSATNQPPIKKYRRPSLSSNSGFEDDEAGGDGGVVGTGTKINKKDNVFKKDFSSSKSEHHKTDSGRVTVAASKGSSSSSLSTMTPQERLKRRMQLALSRQYKADKKAQVEKHNKEEQMKQDREEELRLLAVQMRQRDRERRHREREELERLEAEHEKEEGRRGDGRRRRSRSSSSDSKSRPRSKKRSKRSRSRSRGSRSRSRRSRSRRRNSKSPQRESRLKLVDY